MPLTKVFVGRDFSLLAQTRRLWTDRRAGAVAVVCLLLGGIGVVLRAGSLSGVSPAGASVGNTIAITGTGFNVTAASNEVTFTPGTGPAVVAPGASVTTLDAAAGLRRLQVVVPAGLPTGAAVLKVRNTATGEISQGKTLQVLQLQLPGTRSGPAGGAALSIRITGSSNCQFVVNGTKVSLGADVSITSTTVESATSLLVSATISPSASPGPRTVSVMTGTQTAQLVGGFEVTAANGRPVAQAGGPYSGVAGVPIGLDGSASTDPDHDPLTFSWDFGDGSAIANTPQASHTYASAGTYTATLTVRDNRGGVATATAQVTVATPPPPNRNPAITSAAATAATEGQPYAYDVNATDPDANDVLTYTLTESPTGMTIDAMSGLIAWTPGQAGQAAVTVRVSDGRGGSAQQSFTIAIAAANHNPAFTSSPVTSASEGQPYAYDVNGSDPDAGDTLTFSLVQAPSGMTIDPSSGIITWTPVAANVPSAAVMVRVSDNKGGSATQNFTITVAAAPPPNRQPVITSTPNTSATEGQTYNYDVNATDQDVADTLTYALTQAPTGMSIDATTGLITWMPPPDPSASVHVILTVSDNRSGIASQSFDIAVARAPLGRGVITGWIYDDTTGLPIQNAAVQLLDAAGAPAAGLPVQSDALGRYRLSTAVGQARFRITKPGYTPADLVSSVVEARRVEPDDARLTPLNAATVVVSSVGGGSATHRNGRLTFQAAGLAQDRLVTLTEVGQQGLIRRLPLGWSPLAILNVAAGQEPFGAAAVLSSRLSSVPGVGRDIVLARWDDASGRWIAKGPASRSGDNTSLEAEISGSGQYAFAIADLPPNGPLVPAAGSPLPAVSPRPPPAAQLSLDPAPRILFAQSGARSTVTATAIPMEPVPSGSSLHIDLTESFTFASGAALRPVPGRRRLALYGLTSGQPNTLAASFAVVPSRTLTPFSLREGAIDLAGRLPVDPEAPRGRVFAGTGGSYTAPTGERIVVPAGAATEDLPVDIVMIPKEDFPLAVPAGHVLQRAFLLDLHGAALVRDVQLSIPSAGALPDGSVAMVVQLADVGDATRMVLVAIAQPQGDAWVSSIDPLGNGTVQLPGIRSEGRYAIVVASGNLGFVTGVVTADDGSVVAGAVIDAANLPIGALSDQAGRYALLAPAGSLNLRISNPANGDMAVLATEVTGGFGVTNRPAPLGVSPPTVVSVNPVNGATAVPLGSAITVTFSEPVDPASVTVGGVRLGAGATAVAGTVALTPGNTALTFRPSALLESHTQYVLSIATALTDTAGHHLAAAFVSQFTTIDVTPPPPPAAGAVVASIPDASGNATITGTQGTADPGGVVIVRNLRNNALTTITPNADGSFSGIVAALRTDRLEMTIRDAAGNTTTVPVAPFKGTDGSVVVGATGGRVEGAGGIFVDVPAGAVPDGTVVRLVPVPLQELPVPVPDGYPLLSAVRLDLGGVVAQQTLDIGIPAPPDATADDQILVGRAITIKSGPAWTLAERALLVDGKYRTATPPFPGVLAGGVYAFFRPGGCISYVSLVLQHFQDVLMSVNSLATGGQNPFVYTSDIQSVVLANRCDQPLTIQVRDVSTDALLEEIDAVTPPASGAIGALPPSTDDHVAPRLLHAQTFPGSAVPYVELVFSEPMDRASVRDHLRVIDSDGVGAIGDVELSPDLTVARFIPKVPFKFGEQYHITLASAKDFSTRNLLEDQDITFTPVDPGASPPLATFSTVPSVGPSLTKCMAGACNTSVRDTASFGNVLFLANGLSNAGEQYSTVPARRLIAVDVKQPSEPLLLGWTGRPTNPRVLAAIPDASFTTPQGLLFSGDLLLVASGGRIAETVELPTRVEVYNVGRCTKGPQGDNCLDPVDVPLGDSLPARRGVKQLSTASGQAVVPGVPVESGVPQQMAVLHQRGQTGTFSDTVAAYVVVSGIGLAAIDVTKSFNVNAETPNLGPDGIMRGDFLDVAVIRNRVFAVENTNTAGTMSLAAFSAQLSDKRNIALPGSASRVAALEGLIVDVDGDGRLGSAEAAADDEDFGTPVGPADEIFDFAIVSSGPLTTNCPANVTPCGALDIVDVSGITITGHQAQPSLIEQIPLPGQPFSVQVDQGRLLAYVELRGQGLAIVDLSHLRRTLRRGVAPDPTDADNDSIDDRVLTIIRKPDIFAGEVHVDTNRGIAFVNGATSGLSIVRVADCCTELSLDYESDIESDPGIERTGSRDPDALLTEEKERLFGLLEKAHAKLEEAHISNVSLLEQGSGACFWRDSFSVSPSGTCSAFDPATSDHDIEVFVPQNQVPDAQDVLDKFVKAELDDDESPIHKVGPLTLYAFSKDAFEAGELPVGTPLNKTGDGSGDLAMGRQTLLLLWLLEGEYVKPFVGKSRVDILTEFKLGGLADPNPVVPNEPSRIPRLEGYEWSLLQEYNFYKSGGLLRLAHVCESGAGTRRFSAQTRADANDPDQHFDDNELFTDDCVEQLRTIGKAGIRTAMARLIANKKTNPTVLDTDENRYRASSGCRTAVADLSNPPADAALYGFRPCGSFEEYIASKAVESVSNPILEGPFRASDLPLIFTFYCIKVWEHCKNADNAHTRILRTDTEINTFIAKTLAFIAAAQVETKAAYDEGLEQDTKPIGDIPSLAKIAPLCAQHGIDITTEPKQRWQLRRCNAAIVERKLNGDASVPVAAPLPFEVVSDQDRRKALAKHFGVKNIIFKDLRVRAVNGGSTAVSNLLVRFYEGPGTNPATYTDLHHDQTIATLNEGSSHVIDRIGDDPAYPVAFWMPGLALNGPRALAFSLDPERLYPERDKIDNQAAFFYYKLNTAVPGGPPGLPPKPEAPISDTGPDPLCLPTSDLQLTMVAKYLSDTTTPGEKEITIGVGQSIDLQYSVANNGTVPLTQVTISSSESSVADSGPFVLPPGAQLNPSAQFRQPGANIYEVVARASGRDPQGNWVSSMPSRVRVTVLPPACAQSLVPLDPDPNPVDPHGQPFSSVMLGGRLYRYYRLIDARGRPLAGATVKVQKRQGPGELFSDVTQVPTGADGLIVHPVQGAPDEPGLRLTSSQIGEVGQQFEIRLSAGEEEGACGATFQAKVTPRQFTTSIKGGAAIQAEAAIEVNLSGKKGAGFEFKLDRETMQANQDPVDRKVTVNRTMDAALGVGLTLAKTQAKMDIGSEVSLGSFSGGGVFSTVLMLRDRHEFPIPLTPIKEAAIGQLLLGLIAASAAPGIESAAGPMVALGLNELAERATGLVEYRRAFGGGMGVKVDLTGNVSTAPISLGLGANRKLKFSLDGHVSGAAIGSIDLETPASGPVTVEPALEYRAAVDLSGSLGLVRDSQSEGLSGQEAADLRKSVDFLANLFQLNGAANLMGTVRFGATLDVSSPTDPTLKGITISVSHQKKYGFNAAGFPVASGGDGKVRRLTFRITDRDPSRLSKALATLSAVQALSEQPADVLLNPLFMAEQLVKVIRLADEFDQRVESGKSVSLDFGLGGFLEGVGLQGSASLKLEAIGTHVTEFGTFRRSRRFVLADYDEVDPAHIGPNSFDAAVNTIIELQRVWKQMTNGFTSVSQAVGTAQTLVKLLFGGNGGPTPDANSGGPSAVADVPAQSAGQAGVELEVNGAAETDPTPLVIDLIGFQYRDAPAETGVTPGWTAAVSGAADRPHYGVGGFFHFAPSKRTLAAPARLTIHYRDEDVTGASETTLSIYRWNDVSQDWDRIGGTVDVAANTITANVNQLGLYTAAPALPVGYISMTPAVVPGGTVEAPTSIVTFTSDVVRLNSGAVVPDGTLFTVRPLLGNRGIEVQTGTVQTPDAAPALDGIQVMSQGGVIRFVAELPGAAGVVVPLAFSVDGTAIADQAMAYQRQP